MSAAYTVEIGGTPFDVLKENLDLSLQANWQGTLACDLPSYDGAYRPALRSEVIFKADGVAIFGGILSQAPEQGFGGPNLTQIVHHLSAVSFSTYLTYRHVTETIAAGVTLKAALQVLDNYLPTGVILDPAQVNGPNLTQEFVFVRTRLDECLKALTTDTGYLPEIDPAKLFRMVLPASNAAPFNILDSGPVYQFGDLVVDRTLDDTYANRVLGEISGGAPTSTEVFTAADGVTSGGFIYFTTAFPASLSQNDAWPNQFILNGTPLGPVGFVGISVTNAWDWDAANRRLRYTIASGAPFPAGADTVTVTYAIGYPFYVTGNNAADQALYPIKETFVQIDIAMTLAEAQAYVDALASSRAAAIRRVRYVTLDNRLRPGMSQTVNVAARGINATVLITEVKASCPGEAYGDDLFFDITAIVGTIEAGNVRQTYKDWLKSGGATPQRTGIAGGGVPSLPDRSVQSNRNGAFYGDALLLHDNDASGDDYGVEVLPAKLAVGVPNEALLAMALWNASTGGGGKADALTVWIRNDGEIYIEHDHGSAGLSITDYTGAIQLGSGRNFDISAGLPNAYHLSLGDLAGIRMLAYAIRVITSTPFTLDVAFGGQGETVYFFNHSANGVVNLPALAVLNVAPTSLLFRQIIVKNITAAFTCTIDPNSTELIFDGATSASTLVLTTGQSVTLQARTTGWYVVASHGRVVSGGAPAAHATTHQAGGSDPIKLDDLAAPDDNTDLNASTTAHGLLPKLPNDSNLHLDGTGAWSRADGVLWAGFGSVGNVGTGEDTLLTKTLAANGLNVDGMSLSGRLSGAYAANGNNKTLKVKWNGTTFLTVGPAAVNTGLYEVRFTVTRISSTNARVSGYVITTDAAAAIVTAFTTNATIATTWTGTVTFVVTGEGTADNDVTLTDYKVMRERQEP